MSDEGFVIVILRRRKVDQFLEPNVSFDLLDQSLSIYSK